MNHSNNLNSWVQFKTEISKEGMFKVFLFDYEKNEWSLFLEKEVPEVVPSEPVIEEVD